MEKFSKWADRSSGVNPFVPVLPRSPKSLFIRVPVSLLGFFLALVRMPLALSLLAMAAIGGVLSRYLPVVMAVWAAERAMNGFSSDRIWGTRFLLAIPLLIFAQFGVSIFRVFLVRIPLRLALGVMGIKVEEKHADLRRLGLRSPGAEPPSGRPSGGIYRGDIVVRNSCCFLEVLYLQSRITPQFTAIAAGGDTAPVGVTRVRFGSAVLGCFRPSPSKLSKMEYIMIEALERWISQMDDKTCKTNSSWPNMYAAGSEIRTLMAAMIGRPKIALGSADFASFVEYYDLLQKGKKDEAAKLADKRSKN